MRLSWQDLELRPAQVWGGVRLVPVVRREPLEDLRLAVRSYSDDQSLAITALDRRTSYIGYVPHGIVARWTKEGAAMVPAETRIGRQELNQDGPLLFLKRVARREARDQLRMLPLHLAMEGYLALHFGGPTVARTCYSKRFLRRGLDPRMESVVRGVDLPGLDEALRVFEVHRGQCGLLILIGEQLASATIVAHPDDYLALHRTLLADFYGEIVHRFGWLERRVPDFGVSLDGTDLDAIAASLQAERHAWDQFTREWAAPIVDADVHATQVRKAGPYRLVRFATGWDEQEVVRDGEHLGEAMVHADGRIDYLRTYRLDRGQVRRARILTDLHAHDWDLQALADAQGHGFIGRVVGDVQQSGLGWILNEQKVIEWTKQP